MMDDIFKDALIRFKIGDKLFNCRKDQFIGEFIKFIQYVRNAISNVTLQDHELLSYINKGDDRRCPICLQYHKNVNYDLTHIDVDNIGRHMHCFYICDICSRMLSFDVIIIYYRSHDARVLIPRACAYLSNIWYDTCDTCDQILNNNNLNKLCDRYMYDSIIIFMVGMKNLLLNDVIEYILKLIY